MRSGCLALSTDLRVTSLAQPAVAGCVPWCVARGSPVNELVRTHCVWNLSQRVTVLHPPPSSPYLVYCPRVMGLRGQPGSQSVVSYTSAPDVPASGPGDQLEAFEDPVAALRAFPPSAPWLSATSCVCRQCGAVSLLSGWAFGSHPAGFSLTFRSNYHRCHVCTAVLTKPGKSVATSAACSQLRHKHATLMLCDCVCDK